MSSRARLGLPLLVALLGIGIIFDTGCMTRRRRQKPAATETPSTDEEKTAEAKEGAADEGQAPSQRTSRDDDKDRIESALPGEPRPEGPSDDAPDSLASAGRADRQDSSLRADRQARATDIAPEEPAPSLSGGPTIPTEVVSSDEPSDGSSAPRTARARKGTRKGAARGKKARPQDDYEVVPDEPADAAADAEAAIDEAAPAGGTYTVKKGDTLIKIAKQHHVRLKDLQAINKITPATAAKIKVGQRLKIPRGKG